jgi:hypothetical protein
MDDPIEQRHRAELRELPLSDLVWLYRTIHAVDNMFFPHWDGPEVRLQHLDVMLKDEIVERGRLMRFGSLGS